MGSWLRAGIERYANAVDVEDPATNGSALANTYLANSGVTYAGLSTSESGAADAKQWGGLTVQDDGTITQPASGCTNSRVASVVGGQAIFNIIAAVFADTDASTDVEADTNFNCARNLDAMFQVNEGAIIKNVDGTTYEPATEAAE